MKKVIIKSKPVIFSILLLLLLFGSCKKLNIKQELRIDLGSNFSNQHVKIKLDNELIFSQNISTNQMNGFAEIINLDYAIGKYKISVNVGGIEVMDKFRHKKDRFIKIDFDPTAQNVLISYPKDKIFYN